MAKNSYIYCIVSGQYDSYQIHSAYTSKKAAEDAVRKVNHSGYSWTPLRVEPVRLLSDAPREITIHQMTVYICDDDTITPIQRDILIDFDVAPSHPERHVTAKTSGYRDSFRGVYVLTSFGTDREAVEQKLHDRLAVLMEHPQRRGVRKKSFR